MEAGADDCLSGGLDFRELDLRIRQAIASGSKPVPAGARQDGEQPERLRGSVPRERFRDELARRSADPELKFFCVLDVTTGALDVGVVEKILVDQVRADTGDLVMSDTVRCAVLLQGAREGQLHAFLERLRTRLRERAGAANGAEPTVQVLSHPGDSERIRALLDTW
jgi:hypothetical protein